MHYRGQVFSDELVWIILIIDHLALYINLHTDIRNNASYKKNKLLVVKEKKETLLQLATSWVVKISIIFSYILTHQKISVPLNIIFHAYLNRNCFLKPVTRSCPICLIPSTISNIYHKPLTETCIL